MMKYKMERDWNLGKEQEVDKAIGLHITEHLVMKEDIDISVQTEHVTISIGGKLLIIDLHSTEISCNDFNVRED